MRESRRPLEVLYVRDHLELGGGTTYLLETLPRFDPSRVQPRLCVLGPTEQNVDCIVAAGIPSVFLERPARDPRRLMDLWRIAKHPRPHLMVLGGPRSILQGRAIARLIQVLTLAHINSVWEVGRVERMVQPLLMGNKDQVLAVSQASADWASRAYGVSREKITVLYPGHDTERHAWPATGARAQFRAAVGIGRETPIIGLVGRINLTQKGQDVALRAMPAVRARHPDAVLLLVGGGPDQQRCEELARSLGLAGAVRFTGQRRDIPELLATIDVVLVPSTWEEAFGFVALEAQAAGCPVVASRCGGLPEVVLDQETGLLVPKGDADALAEAVVRLLDEPELARRLGTNGRERARMFTLERHVAELTSLYERLAGIPR